MRESLEVTRICGKERTVRGRAALGRADGSYLVLVCLEDLDAGDLAGVGVAALGGPDVDERVVLEVLGVVEDALAVEGAHRDRLAALAEAERRDEVAAAARRLLVAVQLVPQDHLLLRRAPHAQLAVQTRAHEVAVVLGVEADRRHCSNEQVRLSRLLTGNLTAPATVNVLERVISALTLPKAHTGSANK